MKNQVVEEYNNDSQFNCIKARLKLGWKVVSMVSVPYHIYEYGSEIQTSVIVVYELPEKSES